MKAITSDKEFKEFIKTLNNDELRNAYKNALQMQLAAMNAGNTELVSIAMAQAFEAGKEIQYRGINYPQIQF